MNTIWVLLVWVMLADGDRREYVWDQYDSEADCIEQLKLIDLPRDGGWFAACRPELL